jgi:hypothetical protein
MSNKADSFVALITTLMEAGDYKLGCFKSPDESLLIGRAIRSNDAYVEDLAYQFIQSADGLYKSVWRLRDDGDWVNQYGAVAKLYFSDSADIDQGTWVFVKECEVTINE